MLKRKAKFDKPSLHKVGNLYLMPLLPNQHPVIEYRKFRVEFPNIQVCFLKDTINPIEAILMELLDPSQFKEKDSHYYIVGARMMQKEPINITVGKFELKWDGKEIMCLGSNICEKCFLQGELFTYFCHKHLHCDHGKGKNRIRSCDACVAGTLLGFWKERIDCYQGEKETLFEISRSSSKIELFFKCRACNHLFKTYAANLTSGGTWCPFCAHTKLCHEKECEPCYFNSFASDERSKYWILDKNEKTPRQTFKWSQDKIWFRCNVCCHDFQSPLDHVLGQNAWCYFCRNDHLCDNETCQICFYKSFASHEKSKYWAKENALLPRSMFKSSNKKCWFNCEICYHRFEMRLNHISLRNSWCSYCAHRQLCDKSECKTCFTNSFQSHTKSKFWHPTKNNEITPRQVFKNSLKKYWFHCLKCNHDFDVTLLNLGNGKWCPFCVNRQRCDKPQCKTCAQSCDVCKVRKARTKTQITKTWVCLICLADAIQRDPKETPVSHRAKISLEIFTLAELFRQSPFKCFINNHTSWDCPIFPTLGFKPDLIWCFNEDDEVIALGKAEHLNLNIIKYALVLEIIEGSRKSHSKERSISDEDREAEIRLLFSSLHIPFGMLYLTIAHNNHINKHQDDVFFTKPGQDQEYQILENKKEAWINRIVETRDMLIKMFQGRSNETICIGH